MKIVEISCVTLPLFYHADLFRNPCLPIHLGGYWIVDAQCHGQIGTELRATWSFQEILTKLLVLVVSYLNWSFLLSGSYFQITVVLLLKSHCMKSYILLAGQQIVNCLSEKRGSILQACLIYREIEVMSTEYRRLYSRYMTADVLVSVIIVHTISLYACINFGIELPLSMFFMFVLAALNTGVVLIFMYTSLANVYKASKYVLEVQLKTGKDELMMRQNARFRRFRRSCKVVKVYIGNSNYVEPLTPLTMEQFAIDQTISLMLLKH